ncbi:uncharacterized protein LOC133205635 [Saccostrea echinata]|uniref:uncharacterized protein LOC133205635 n=1 Tax=Saccostrea echinata TaxID=191078 RepID=UPI002A83AB57|nr:uncharacterized protein LOC133205635 [Saccostrea echinata]
MAEIFVNKNIELALTHLHKLRFAVLELGLCNATRNVLFSDAVCKFDLVRVERPDEESKRDVRSLNVNFSSLFKPGIDFLTACQNTSNENIAGIDALKKDALSLLNSYFLNIDLHEQSLNKVTGKKNKKSDETDIKHTPPTDTDFTIAVAEHLLGKLAPGQSYHIDSRGKEGNRCGCEVQPSYGNTGIGHEEVWHGHADIIFSPHHPENQSIAKCDLSLSSTPGQEEITAVKRPHLHVDENLEYADRKTNAEVKRRATWTSEEAIAQTIVFSLLQKQQYPNSPNCVVPSILISPDYVQIMIYDAENDILLCSNFMDLYNVNADGCLSSEAVVTIWCVLHYRIFCCGLQFENNDEANIYKSNFSRLAQEKWHIYSNCLKNSVNEFPVVDSAIKVELWNRKVLQGTEFCKGMKRRK